MTPSRCDAPWHRESYDRFLHERLPSLLAERLPLAGYKAESTGPRSCRVEVEVYSGSGTVTVEYADTPQPDEDGVFELDGLWIVPPYASCEELDEAEVKCVGELLYDAVESRLGAAPADLPWDPELLRTWLPLGEWVRQFVEEKGGPLDETNWLAIRSHHRRIWIPTRETVTAPGQLGRACPFETAEGTNVGKILSIAQGAEVRDGRLVIVDDSPGAALGLSASMVPFIEHSDANRVLMGCNMMRQWLVPPDPEPALVQTGNEPDAPGSWCGRNLLTAFVSWGGDTFEDALGVSESAAVRLGYPEPLEPGDKLSNRHGQKGVVSRILPDDEMPHLADGTPADIVVNFIGLHTRLNFGQVREAGRGRIARAEGRQATVPPYAAPNEAELRARLAAAGLPESGMERLTDGKDGAPLDRSSTAGWVYWGKTHHLAALKIHAAVALDEQPFNSIPGGGNRASRQGVMEYWALRNAGAFELAADTWNLRSVRREGADKLAARVAAGPVERAEPPTPAFIELQRLLRVAGIGMELAEDEVRFGPAEPEGEVVELAGPVPHPWLRDTVLSAVGAVKGTPQYARLVEANERARHMSNGGVPEGVARRAFADLGAALRDYLDALLGPQEARPGDRLLFSGRTVICPGPDLSIDQIGVAEEIAWTLFGPLVVRELGDHRQVKERSPRATEALDRVMAASWVLINRAPTLFPGSIMAFHPVRVPDGVIRLHPLCCRLMNADFDGDAVAVLLPLTQEAQREAGELLSVAGLLRRDPGLVSWLFPPQDILWGLARLSLAPDGLREVSELLGTEVRAPEGFVTRESLVEGMRTVLERGGTDGLFEGLQRLMDRGFEVARASGASLSPFVPASRDLVPEPDTDDPDRWDEYAEEIAERLISVTDVEHDPLGPQALAVKTEARGRLLHLQCLAGTRGCVTNVDGRRVILRHGFVEGLTAQEAFACAAGAREGIGQTVLHVADSGRRMRAEQAPKGFHVLARAMRAERPGIVFARAAATGEVDPLTDVDARLFVGLRV